MSSVAAHAPALAAVVWATAAAAQDLPPSPQAPEAQPPRPSPCYAFVDRGIDRRALPVQLASFVEGLERREAGITFIGHATFLIESPEGVTVATDYSGNAGPGVVPNAVTMNGAHITHYTNNPDPRIGTVLRGWRRDGAPAAHDAQLDDLRIRSVSTDTISYGGTVNPNGNSIFVFEINDLCIGHLGHLHHVPTEAQLAQIGFLDVVIAPVDGGYTLSLDEMVETLEKLRARVILPMHSFGSFSLERFLTQIGERFPVVRLEEPTMVVRKRELPRSTTVMVLPAMTPRTQFDD